MTVKTKFKSAVSNWREICQNYIGGLGYYLLFLAAALVVIRLYMQLAQYVIYSRSFKGISIPTDTTMATSYQPGFLEGLVVYGISLIVIAVSLAVVLLIPYAFGYLFNKANRQLLDMTSLELNYKNLFKLKYGYSLAVVTIVLLTIYDYSGTVDGNWYGFMLLGLSSLALVLFWVQSLLVRCWKIKVNKVY